MKKTLFLLVLIAGVAATAFWCIQRMSRPAGGDEYYALWLPSDTLASVALSDLKGLTKKIPESTLGKTFAKPVVHNILGELGAQQVDMEDYDALYDGIANVMSNPVLQQLFGDDAVLAMLPPDTAQLAKDPLKTLQHSLIALGTSSAAGSIDSIARLTMSTVTKETISGLAMTRISLDANESLYGFAQDGVVLLAYTPERIRAAVQQKTNGAPLRDNPLFAKARKFWEEVREAEQYARSYVNIGKLRELMTASSYAELRELSVYLQGMTSAGSVAEAFHGGLRIVKRVEYDMSGLHESLQRFYQTRSDKNLSLSLLTEKTAFYSWFSALHPQWIEQLLSIQGKAQYEAQRSAVEQELGLPLAQLAAALGPQIGMAINGIANTGIFPVPEALFFVQMQQPETVQQAIDALRAKIVSRGFTQEQALEEHGQKFYAWKLLPVEAAHPAIALTKQMLYAANANGADGLKTMLAQGEGQLSEAMRTSLGVDIAEQITAANSSVLMLRPALLAQQGREAADWIAETVAASKNVSVQRLKEELLRLMRSVEYIAYWDSMEETHILSHLVLKPAPEAVAQDK